MAARYAKIQMEGKPNSLILLSFHGSEWSSHSFRQNYQKTGQRDPVF